MQLTVRDVTRLLNVSEKTIYRWIKQKSLPAYRVNDQYRFNRSELIEWVTSQKVQVPAEFFDEPEHTKTSLLGLHDALRAGGVFYRVSGADKDSVLHSVVELMRVPEGVDRDYLLRVILARESLASTGVGDGIAIPHARNPIVLHVTKPIVTLCFLEAPVEFGAIDGRPVHTLFSLVSPTARAHLHLLSRIAYALRDNEFRLAIERQAPREVILAEAHRVEESLARAHASEDQEET